VVGVSDGPRERSAARVAPAERPAPPAVRTEQDALRRCEALLADRLPDLGRDRDACRLRLRHYWPDLWAGLHGPYGEHPDFPAFLERLAVVLADAVAGRSDDLRLLDLDRTIAPDWVQRPDTVGYVAYADRFAGSLAGVAERLDYLEELGVRYLHLMPLLQPRPGDSDGGYAVADYRAVDPRLGTIDDLERLCARLRARGMSLCVDLVLNHCAAEHEWALAARRGDPEYEALFHVFPDRTLPDAYERTLPEVFPDFAPGSFSLIPETGRWVWTTFNRFQWDLNWANPRVFLEMTDILLALANRGVEVFRLDAVAFMWKRLGTDCQNQPEVHSLLRALRACARIAAPAVAFKAEAIVSPTDLVPYLGAGEHYGRGADLAYQNSLMVQLWSTLATRDTALMTHVLGRLPAKPPTSAWATYVRGHDDIGWAITEEDAAAVGLDGWRHRAFLSDYYAGEFPGSHARGAVFQENPATGDRRISGATASLAGLELAVERGDEALVELAVRRILLAHALILGYDGVPLLYMGDELGLPNDHRYLEDPTLAGDNRWLNRPRMDWERAALRHEPGSVERRVFVGLRRLVGARRTMPQFHAAVPLEVLDLGHRRLFAFRRPHPARTLVAVHNMGERDEVVSASTLSAHGMLPGEDRLDPDGPRVVDGHLRLSGYQVVWLLTESRES
jgi:amylosucrase